MATNIDSEDCTVGNGALSHKGAAEYCLEHTDKVLSIIRGECSIHESAKAAGMTYEYLSRLEWGMQKPTVEDLLALTEVYGGYPDVLFEIFGYDNG